MTVGVHADDDANFGARVRLAVRFSNDRRQSPWNRKARKIVVSAKGVPRGLATSDSIAQSRRQVTHAVDETHDGEEGVFREWNSSEGCSRLRR